MESRSLSLVDNKKSTPLEFINRGQLEGDHANNVVQRDMLKLNPRECGVVFMGDSEHDLIGKAINYLMPDEISYTPGTGGTMTFINCIENDNVSVIKVVFAQQDGDLFYTEGYNEEVVIRGYKNASNFFLAVWPWPK